MANINLNVVALGDFNQLKGQLDRLHAQVTSLNSALAATNTKLSTSELKRLTDHLDNAIKSTGLYTSQTVQLSSAAQHLGERIQKNNTTWRDFRYALRGVNDESTLYNKLGQRQVAMHKSLLTSMGDMVRVYTAHNVNMSDAGNKSAVFTEAIRAQNAVLTQGATKVINWGKNMQWAGRQLTAGLAMPVVLLSTQLAKMYNDVDKNLTNLAKVYGVGLQKPTEAMLAKVRTDVLGLAKDLAQTLGISANEVTDIAAQFAAAGLTGQELISATNQAARMVVLGETDKQEAIKATIALQTAYKLNTTDLTEAVNFFNAAQAATSTSMADLIEAVPKVGPVVRGLGGSYKDMVAIMTALKEGGVPAGEAANAIKNSMARLINPTKAASDRLKGFGIDIGGIVSRNAGNLTGMIVELQKSLDTLSPLDRQKAIAELFGKFQYARMAALMDNFNKTGSQSAKVMEMMGLSAAELSSIADEQTKKIQQSASGRFKIAVETLKNDLLPIGEMALGKFTQLVEKINELANTMQNLPAPVKAVMKAFAIATIFAGPLIMITGLMGNFFGFILKGLIPIRALFTAITHGVNPMGVLGKKFELLSAEEIAARNSSKLFSDQALKSASSVDIMTEAIEKQIQALQQYESTLGGMGTQAVMGETTASGTANISSDKRILGSAGRLVEPNAGNEVMRAIAINGMLTGSGISSGGIEATSDTMASINKSLGTRFMGNVSGSPYQSYIGKGGKFDMSKVSEEHRVAIQEDIDQIKRAAKAANLRGLSDSQYAQLADQFLPIIEKSTQAELRKIAHLDLESIKDAEYLAAKKKLSAAYKNTGLTETQVQAVEQEFLAVLDKKIASDSKYTKIVNNLSNKTLTTEQRIDNYNNALGLAGQSLTNAWEKGVTNIGASTGLTAAAAQNEFLPFRQNPVTGGKGIAHTMSKALDTNKFKMAMDSLVVKLKLKEAGVVESTVAEKEETVATKRLTLAEVKATAAVEADAAAHAADAAATLGGEGGAPGKGGIRGMLGKPGVKFGAGMALGIGGSMLANMIPEGSAAKQPATMAAQGAGLGMMFGPYGALIGTALGALAGGFMELNHQAKVAAAGLKSTLGVSKEELGALGVEIPKLTSALPDFNNATVEAKTAVENFKKAIEEASDTSEMKGFVNKLKEAGADQDKIDALVKQKATAMALAGLKKEDVQTAIAGYMESAGLTRTNFDVGSLYGANGKAVSSVGVNAVTGALSGVGLTAGQEAIPTTVMAGRYGPQPNIGMNGINNAAGALEAPFEALISTNTGLQEFLNTVRELDSQDFSNTTAGGQTLNKTLTNLVANNPQLKALNDKLKDKTPAERMFYLRAAVEGVGGSIANLPNMKTIDIQILLNQKAVNAAASGVNADIAARAALNTSDVTSESSGGGGGGGESKKNKAIDAKIKANQKLIDQIKEEQAQRKKLIDLENKENEFLKTKMGLQNQLKDALASGNLLQAAQVREEISALDAKKAQEDQQSKMDDAAEARIKALEEANKKLEESKSKSSGGGGGGGSSEAAQQKAQEDIAKQIDDNTKKTLNLVNANKDLQMTYGEFTSSKEVKDFNDYLKGLGATSEEIEKKNQELWASYAPTKDAMKGSEEFNIKLKEAAKQFGLNLEDPKQYERASAIAIRTLQDSIKEAKFNGTIELKTKILNNKIELVTSKDGKTIRLMNAATLAGGGYISGPGGPKSDMIPAMLSNGEYVLNAAAVAKYGVPMIESMNRMKYGNGGYVVPSSPRMANGGSVSSNNINAVFNISGADAQQVADQAIKKLELMMKRNGSTVRI